MSVLCVGVSDYLAGHEGETWRRQEIYDTGFKLHDPFVYKHSGTDTHTHTHSPSLFLSHHAKRHGVGLVLINLHTA